MFKIAAPPIIAGSILCALQAATGPPASALDQWVELTNNTRMTIVEIYISHVGAQLWDIDLLGTDFSAPAEDDEFLAEQLHLLWQIAELVRGAHRLPVTAQEFTHRASWLDARQLIVRGRCLPSVG